MKLLFTLFMAIVAFFAMASADVECPVFCPSNFLPVCAQSENGGSPRTFSNQCALDFEICDKKEKFTVVVESACP
ncbi:unnamed protein product [Diamesa hyperborea]